MKKEDIQFWRDTIKNCEKFYKPKHERWRKLIKLYNMEIEVPGMENEFVVKVSRYFPLVRKLIASIAFNYPRVFMSVDDEPFEFASEALERFANDSLEVMNVKPEVHQSIFDALFCFRGWLKIGFNTANNSEAEAPYIFNDALEEDFCFVKRVSPFNIFVDPLVPPNDYGSSTYTIEKMLVPMEFAKADPRFNQHKRQFVPLDAKESDTVWDDMLVNFENGEPDSADETDAIKEAKRLQKMVLLYEIHDRIHRRRIVFANDIDEPIEDVDHPFLARKPITTPDPFQPQQQLMTGDFEAPEGWLTSDGSPYFSMCFDVADKFLGIPLMEYVKDPQQLIVESISRRVDLLKKHARISVGDKAEKTANADLPDSMSGLGDGDILWLNDVNSIKELSWGSVPNDQINIERDALMYESQILQVEARNSNTATEASINASEAQLNREWMQVAIVDCYSWIVDNALALMSDTRFTPNSFVLNIAPEGEPIVNAALQHWWLQGRRRIDIEAGSMLPLIEQLERDDTLGLFDRMIALPEVDRTEAIKMMIKAFRKIDPDKLLKDDVNADAMKAAQMELVGWILRGQDPGVGPDEDHQTHLQLQQPETVQQMPEFAALPPQGQQMALAVAAQHTQGHQAALQAKAGQLGQPTTQQDTAPEGLMGQVASNAQSIASSVQQSTASGANTAQQL